MHSDRVLDLLSRKTLFGETTLRRQCRALIDDVVMRDEKKGNIA